MIKSHCHAKQSQLDHSAGMEWTQGLCLKTVLYEKHTTAVLIDGEAESGPVVFKPTVRITLWHPSMTGNMILSVTECQVKMNISCKKKNKSKYWFVLFSQTITIIQLHSGGIK